MFKQIFSIIFLFTIIPIANGEIISTLYSANTQVTSKSVKARNEALPRTLKEVLIKVGGISKITTNPKIYFETKKANRYVKDYKYISIPKENDKTELLLHVTFHKKLIDELIKKSGYFIWSENRPITMIWLAINTTNHKQIIGNDSDQIIVNTIKKVSYQRGLPIILPILDISDLHTIDYQDISETNINIIKKASERYDPQEILIAYVNASNKNNITGYFTLLRKMNQIKWKTRGNNILDVINLGLNHATEELAERFTYKEIQKSSIKLTISNLSNIDDYIKIITYLNKLNGITKTDVINISKTELNIQLSLNTDTKSLTNEINKDALLEPIKIDNSNNFALYYMLKK